MDQIKIGRFIAEMRRQKGLTQRGFADMLGISDKTVSKWERGSGMPELSLMRPVCGILEIDLNELFSGERLTEADYKKKAEENMADLVKEAEALKKNIVGEKVMGNAASIEMDAGQAHGINAGFWNETGNDILEAIVLPKWSSFLPSEEKLGLMGDLSGKRVLEIGCGNGKSLKYAAGRGAEELWGLDISGSQIERAREFLESCGIKAKLVCAPMEEECSLPAAYFDLVYSVYGIGWTTDLDGTFRRIYSYLKNDGLFIFSWSHPIHKCVSNENGRLVFSNSYFDEDWYCADINGRKIALSNRMMGTYINSLAANGFFIEEIAEETDRESAMAQEGDFGRKALMLPTAFAIKARKRVME